MSESQWSVPTMTDVLKARRQIAPFLHPTACYAYPGLAPLTGTETWIKHENHQPVGAFKVRGGINLISQLDDAEREVGVAAASTGNHGQSVAWAAKRFGVHATICVPAGANPVKVESIRAMDAEVVEGGRDFDEARERCEELSAREGYRYIHSGNEPLLIAGVATATLEILQVQPDFDVLIVPVGGGSGAAGACIVAKSLRPQMTVIGVQSEGAPAAFHSWKGRALCEGGMATFAEGLATRSAFELPQRILWELLDDFLLVSDEEIRQAMVLMIERTRNLVEAAGAAPLAAAIRLRDHLTGRRVALMCSGGNVSTDQLRSILAD